MREDGLSTASVLGSQKSDSVARFEPFDLVTHGLDDPNALVPDGDGFGIRVQCRHRRVAFDGHEVRVAEGGGHDFDKHVDARGGGDRNFVHA